MASSTEPTPKETAFLPDPKDDLEPEIPRSTPEPTTHRANCHCGAVRYTVTLKYPFPKYKINRCTCSICTKNGYLLVYPPRKDVVWLSGYDKLSSYSFATNLKSHKFCSICGSSVMIDFQGNQHGETDPEKDRLAINARLFADIDFEKDELKYEYWDGKNKMNPKYPLEEIWG